MENWFIIGLAITLLLLPTASDAVRRRLLARKGMIPLKLLLEVNNLEQEAFWECCRHLKMRPRVKRVGTTVMIEQKVALKAIDQALALKSEARAASGTNTALAAAAAVFAASEMLKTGVAAPTPTPPQVAEAVSLLHATTIQEALDSIAHLSDSDLVIIRGFWKWLQECEEVDTAMRLLCEIAVDSGPYWRILRARRKITKGTKRDLYSLGRVMRRLPHMKDFFRVIASERLAVISARYLILSLSSRREIEIIWRTYKGTQLRQALYFAKDEDHVRHFIGLMGPGIVDRDMGSAENN